MVLVIDTSRKKRIKKKNPIFSCVVFSDKYLVASLHLRNCFVQKQVEQAKEAISVSGWKNQKLISVDNIMLNERRVE